MKAKVLLACVACALLFLAAGAARAQRADLDPIGQNFFAPDLVMQHQEAIGMTDEQKSFLKAEIRQAQLSFTDWQWKLQEEMEKMAKLVKQPRVDEQEVLTKLEKVLAIERAIKRTQMTLLIRIKNNLTPGAAGQAGGDS